MKVFYILMNQFVSVFLSANTVTTLHFDTKISYCDVGLSKEHLELKYRRKRTTVSLIPRIENIDSNMTCYMEKGEIYVFNLKWSEKRIHKNITVKPATRSRGGRLVLDTKEFKIFDSGKNYILHNKTDKNIIVNESIISKDGFVSKWSPIIINGKEVYL